MSDIMEYFNNDPTIGSQEEGEFANVTGLVLGRNDSFHNVEMGFKDPDNPDSPSKDPSMAPSRNVSVSQDPTEANANGLNEVKSRLVPDEDGSAAPTAEPSPAHSRPAQTATPPGPKPLESYDFSYSADSRDHDSPTNKNVGGEGKYTRQVSSPIMDHLIDNLSDVDESLPKIGSDAKTSPEHDEDINQFMGSIPSNFDKPKQPVPIGDKPKISPRLAEKAEERRKSSASESAARAAAAERQPSRPPAHHPAEREQDPQDMAVIAANKEKKKKKKPTDSYMGEFEVVAAGKKPAHAAKDYDEQDMKNKPRKKKSNDSYLSDIPVVKVSEAKKSPRAAEGFPEVQAGRRPSQPKESRDRNPPPAVKKGRVQKPANDSYLTEMPVVHAKKPSAMDSNKEGRSSYEELELKRKSAKETPVRSSKPRDDSESPERRKPQPPSSKKPPGGRRVEPAVVLPRLVQSDQTNSRNKKIANISSRDDSNDYNGEEAPRKKKKKPLYMRLQQKALRQQGEIEREKMAAYALLREQKKQGQPSHEELLQHRQRYAELKREEEQRKREAREYRESEWRKMQQMLEEKNEAVVSHVPSHSPLKRNASDVHASDEGSIASRVSQKRERRPRRRSVNPSDGDADDDDSVVSGAARRQDDVYLPNIVSPAKLSPRGAGKARRARRREEEEVHEDENREPRRNERPSHAPDDISDISHDELPPRRPPKEEKKKQVRMAPPPETGGSEGSFSRPEPIHTEDSMESNNAHVRFADNNTGGSRKSHESDNSDNKSGGDTVVMNLRGPQYVAELLEADPHEDDLAQMYETGFEMQMVERGMMETPSAAKAAAGAQNRVPR